MDSIWRFPVFSPKPYLDSAWQAFLILLIGLLDRNKCSMNYPIGQLSPFLLPLDRRQVPSFNETFKVIFPQTKTVNQSEIRSEIHQRYCMTVDRRQVPSFNETFKVIFPHTKTVNQSEIRSEIHQRYCMKTPPISAWIRPLFNLVKSNWNPYCKVTR